MPRKAQGTKRRKRDPDRPKRAMTAYMVYVRDNIKTVTRDMGNAKRSEVLYTDSYSDFMADAVDTSAPQSSLEVD